MQAINVEGLSLDKFLEHQVNNNGWALEKGGKVQFDAITAMHLYWLRY